MVSEVNRPPYQLFHRIADADCAEVRRQIFSSPQKDQVQFRNVDTGPEALADLRLLLNGGDQVPCLRGPEGYWLGKSAILKWLSQQS